MSARGDQIPFVAEFVCCVDAFTRHVRMSIVYAFFFMVVYVYDGFLGGRSGFVGVCFVFDFMQHLIT